MNVLMVDQYGQTGGAQKCLLDLIADWPRDGNLVVAAPEDGTLLRSVRDSGFLAEAIPSGPYASSRRRAFDALWFCGDAVRQRAILRGLIGRYRSDVVYVNGPRVLLGAALAAQGRCPVVFHAHNNLQRRSDLAMVKFALGRCSSTVIACCEHAGRGLHASIVRNGVPDAGYRLRRYPPEGAWRLGIIGRISPEKGHLLLIDAVQLLNGKGYRIALTVAGASLFGSNEYEKEVRARAEGLDARFTGWVENVGETLSDLDLLIVPSTAEPGLPRVVLEAFSAGVPVVVMPTGGIPEAVRDSVTGFLVQGSAPADLAERLRSVMGGSPADLERVALSARLEWENYWNVERWRSEVMRVIQSAAKGPLPVSDWLAASAEASGGHPAAPVRACGRGAPDANA
jgi:glycosyltransferase involved in cell wall biosynthesis